MADIPVNANDRRVQPVVTDAMETDYAFDFLLYDEDDITIWHTRGLVTTKLTNGLEFSIPPGSIGEENGGIFVIDLAELTLEEDDYFTCEGNTVIQRLDDYQPGGDYRAENVNQEGDNIVIIAQELRRDLGRAALLPRELIDADGYDPTLPLPVANRTIAWDPTGKKMVNGPLIGAIENAADNAAAAAASAAAALVSENNASASETAANNSAIAADASADAAAADAASADADAATASSAASTATTQAGIATTQAGIATTQAGNASTSAATATTQAGIATTQAGIATTQAGNAATSATNASNSQTAAAASAAAAAASAAEGLYNDVIVLTFANSPYTPSAAQEGTLFKLDTTGGAIVINLSTLATYNEDMKFGFVKIVASANNVTINRGGSDTISGGTSVVLANQYETHVLVGDSGDNTWVDTVQTTGIADGAVTTAKLNDAVFSGLTAVTIATDDYVAIADTSDTGKKKKALVSDITALVTVPSATTAAEGKIRMADQTAMEAKTTGRAVTADVQHFHPLMPKAWARWNGTGTAALQASHNVTSLTDNGTGDYTINLSITLATVGALIASGGFLNNAVKTNGDTTTIHSFTTSSVRVCSQSYSSGAHDKDNLDLVVFGDI